MSANEETAKKLYSMENIALFWDIENVTPSSSDTLFIEGLFEYVEGMGRIVTSFAYAEWSKGGFTKLGMPLAQRQFKLIHVPHRGSGKNSADMQLVSDALELLRFYSHIDTYILITGDSDFRPLLLSLRKSGKRIHIICDMQTAAQDLLALADSFIDYRDLLPSSEDDEDEQEEAPVRRPKSYWFERLAEAAAIQTKQNKSLSFSAVKIRMKMLNPDFNENDLGYRRFSHFVMAASRRGYVGVQRSEDESRLIEVLKKDKKEEPDSLQVALNALIECLKAFDKDKKESSFHRFHLIASELQQQYHIELSAIGFPKFKKFMQLAEKRGIVEIRSENLVHLSARLKNNWTKQ
jgi:uncharacterized LabA/DUF88 family protein